MTVDDLIKNLDSAGDLPAGFGKLLRTVPRELFIPNRIWVLAAGSYQALDRNRDPALWTSMVYSNRSIVTQFDDGRILWPNVGRIPTCSASAPDVVGAMLSALDVQPGQSVLEIGTGTGFNAALLAESVGELGHVSTIEVDSAVAASANEHLEASGYGRTIRMLTEDGEKGDPDFAPFDRVIATAAVQMGHLPYAWVKQTRPGGVIVAPVRGALSSGPLVRFEVQEDGTAVGRAQPMGVGFMELRSQRTPGAGGVDWDDERGETRLTDINPVHVLNDPHSRWALAVGLPSCRYDLDDGDGNARAWLKDPVSQSWATVQFDGTTGTVRQHGPRRLWDEAEATIRWWLLNEKPTRSHWVWTITPDRQSVTPPQ